jgi:hypothetical protein
MDSVNQVPSGTRTIEDISARRMKWNFIIGMAWGATIAFACAFFVNAHMTNKWNALSDLQNAKIASLTKNLSDATNEIERDRQEIRTIWNGDGTRTILVDTNAAGGRETAASFMTNSMAAREYGTVLMGRAWVIPKKIVPQTTDGSLGFQYAYVSPDGKIDGWYQPQRAQ